VNLPYLDQIFYAVRQVADEVVGLKRLMEKIPEIAEALVQLKLAQDKFLAEVKAKEEKNSQDMETLLAQIKAMQGDLNG